MNFMITYTYINRCNFPFFDCLSCDEKISECQVNSFMTFNLNEHRDHPGRNVINWLKVIRIIEHVYNIISAVAESTFYARTLYFHIHSFCLIKRLVKAILQCKKVMKIRVTDFPISFHGSMQRLLSDPLHVPHYVINVIYFLCIHHSF